jgi:ribosomal-protein-alanine N-acetyltransferase
MAADFTIPSSERLILRQLNPDDAADIFTIFSDPEVVRLHDIEVFQQVEQAEDLIRSFASRFDTDAAIRWGITRRGSKRIVGTCGCT